MTHRARTFKRSPLRWPGLLLAGWWHGSKVLLARLLQALLFRAPSDASRVAVYRIGSFGDHTCALPALRAIRARYPAAQILLLSNAVEGEPWARRLGHEAELKLQLAAYAGASELQAAVTGFGPEALLYLAPHPLGLRRAMRDMLFFRMSGVKRARGFSAISARGWVARALRPWLAPEPEAQRLLGSCRLAAPQAAASAIQAMGKVVLAPAGKSPVQHWPRERWLEIAQRVQQLGLTPVWLGDAADAARLGELPGENSIGKLDLRALPECLRGANAVLCHDSGIAHLAAALGCGTVVLSSSRAPLHAWDPWPRATVLRMDMNCEACHLAQCSDNACINAISVDAAWSALRVHLESVTSS